MNPLALATQIPLLQDLGICHVEVGVPSMSLCLFPITSAFGKGCGTKGFCLSVLWAPLCHSHTAQLFFFLIKDVQSTIWVPCFPHLRVVDSRLIWRSSNHTVKRNINLNQKKKKKNYSICLLIQPPMTQQKTAVWA